MVDLKLATIFIKERVPHYKDAFRRSGHPANPAADIIYRDELASAERINQSIK